MPYVGRDRVDTAAMERQAQAAAKLRDDLEDFLRDASVEAFNKLFKGLVDYVPQPPKKTESKALDKIKYLVK